jgi:hypothetical protein
MPRIKRAPRRIGYYVAPYLFSPLRWVEQPRLAAVDLERRIEPPPIFIIGAPRTGSTLLYQTLTNCYQVSYISNLASLFVRSLWIGERLHRAFYRGTPHNCFTSIYGKTQGLNSPSECGKFWYRWFPKDRHFVTPADVDPAGLGRLRQTMAAITADGGVPMVFKNLNCGQRLQVLRHVLPEALFLFILRNPFHTARSILEGRIQRHGGKNSWSSVMPPNVAELKRLPWPAQIAGQVYALEDRISQDLQLFPQRQSFWLHYEDFCADPSRSLQRIEAWVKNNGVDIAPRKGARLPSIRACRQPAIDPHDHAELEREIATLDWNAIYSRGPESRGPVRSAVLPA